MTQSNRPASERDDPQQARTAADDTGRVGKYGGDDGALEHERVTEKPEGLTGNPTIPPESDGGAQRQGGRP